MFGPPRSDDRTTVYGSQVNPFGVEPTGPELLPGALDWSTLAPAGTDVSLPALGHPDRFYRIGPRDDLIGSAADELADEVDVLLDDGDAFLDVDTGSGRVPALLTGTITTDVDEVAVTVNGRVVATAPTHRTDGTTRLAVMLPPTAVEDGDNEVRVFRLG